MQTKFETLKKIIAYVKNESENPIDELLMMGFTPCQLVYEFGFNEDDVKASGFYDDINDGLLEDIDCDELPFALENFNPFDAEIVFRFKLNKNAFSELKGSALYKELLEKYIEEKEDTLVDCANAAIDAFEDEILSFLEENE